MGVAWYRETDWPRIEAMFSDADELHDSYAGSLKSAKGSVERLARPGVTVEPFVLNIDDFVGWCTVHRRPRDAKDRCEYVAEPEVVAGGSEIGTVHTTAVEGRQVLHGISMSREKSAGKHLFLSGVTAM
jgi:hypothetical protein